MKKKFLLVLLAGVLGISMVACNKSSQEGSNQEEIKMDQTDHGNEAQCTNELLGIEFTNPDIWKTNEENIVGVLCSQYENIVGEYILNFISDETKEKIEKLEQESEAISEDDTAKMETYQTEYCNLLKEQKELCAFVTVDKRIAEGASQKELLSAYGNADLINKQGNFEYYFLYNDPDTSGLSEESKKEYDVIYAELKNIKNSIKTFEPVPEKTTIEDLQKLEFETETLEGEAIDSSIFTENKITMINIWATFCGPCIEEMKDIQELYEEVKNDKINVIGIVSDTPDEETEALAKNILEKKGVKFTNMIPDKKIKEIIQNDIPGVPTTLFVDSEGNLVGEYIVGSRSKEEYKKEIESRLQTLE